MANCEEDDFHENLIELHASSAKRFNYTFKDIIAKYDAVPRNGRDVVDISNLTIVEDYGQIRRMQRKPCGYYAKKYFVPHKERLKIQKLLKKIKEKSGRKDYSPRKRIQPGLLEKTQEKLSNLTFSSKNMKVPVLESSPKIKKLRRDSLIWLKDNVIENSDLKKELRIVNDLFTYKSKEPKHSNISMIVNVSPSKENQSEDSLIKNECLTPKNTPSHKSDTKIECLFKYSRSCSTPRRQQKHVSSVDKQLHPTPKNNTKLNDLTPFRISSVKKSRLELVDNSTKNKTPTSNKSKASDLNQKKSVLSNGEENIIQYSSTPRHQRKCRSFVMKQSSLPLENNTTVDDLISCDISSIEKSKLELAANSSEGKDSTSYNRKAFDMSEKTLDYGVSSNEDENIVQSSLTLRQQQKLQSLTPGNAKVDDIVSLDFPSIEKAKLELAGNSSESKILTSKKSKAFDLNRKKSTDRKLNNGIEKLITFNSSKKIYGLKYASSVTPISLRKSLSFVMKSSPRVIMDKMKEDDLVCFINSPTKLFPKKN